MEIETKTNENKKKKARVWMSDSDIQFIMKLIYKLLKAQKCQESFEEMYETRNKIIKEILDEFFNTRDLPLPKEFDCICSPFHNIFIDKKVAILSQTKAEKTIDLNKYGSVYEVNELLQKLEERDVVKILSIIERLKNFPKTDPFMRYLIVFHILFGELQNLETVAANYVSLREEMNVVATIIQKWIFWQLKSWDKTTESLNEGQLIQAQSWFVNVWKMVDEMVNNEVDEQIELGFLESMNQFMYKCTYGQFEERLKVLGIVIQICECSESQNARFGKVRETKFIETNIKEFVKLIRWNDINHEKIKDQVEKSNRKLNGFKREYDDILKKNVQFVVQSQTFANTTSATDKALGPIFKEIHKSEKIKKTVDSKKRTDNIENLGVVWLEEVKKDLIGSVVELQNLTGKKGVKTKK
ncbi:hypothetical protein EIN_509080 [Entamoeba invadens IP1]|uniref:Uncharacterized protein n=1 Tax=Entamoeba invadens IP1 TaxID=370355 RepID=A0A0A1UCC5_ENTIV|nr:hypothetical protein EIN_509080 [Entamoeba invadens IP1]ELP92887.1 hypothetical protein EIN_509080 [Entamoeba invadens IP1]|eukprot:XP_004259658.1 hypothetical protein EIN_509080 [Entamoeba invadens IP1]